MASILICGNTMLFTREILQKMAGNFQVVVAGETNLSGKYRNVKIYHISPMEKQFTRLFDVYNFRAVCFISGYVDGGNGLFGENQILERVMLECGRSRTEKLIVLSSVDSQNCISGPGETQGETQKEYSSVRSFSAAQMEEMCRYFTEKNKMKTIILRLPYLTGKVNDKNFLGRVFWKIYEKEEVMFPYRSSDPADFLSLKDLAGLLAQIAEETEDTPGSYDVGSGARYTYGELEQVLKQLAPGCRISYEKQSGAPEAAGYSMELREKYGFIPMDNIMENIGTYYRSFLRETARERRGLPGKILETVRAGRGVLKYLELLALFLIAEAVCLLTSDSIYFDLVDIRLLYVVAMGTIYGMRMGLLAAGLECVALVHQYALAGVGGTLLFYNIQNWIPFAAYLMVGSITGYVSSKNADAVKFEKEQYALLRKKYLFLSDAYHGAVENKGELKRQILGFQDSFGKIFDAVQRLDSELPESIFFSGLKVLEEIVENETISIYTLDASQKYGRLAVCSSRLVSRQAKSIRMDSCREVYETVKSQKVWKNEELRADLPMYACGIMKENKVALLITIKEAKTGQYTMRYMNVFQILCGLVQTSFLRAMEYEELKENQIYYPGTNIVYPDRLRQMTAIQKEMKKAGVADYMLIRFDETDKKLVDERLRDIIRANDVVGMDEAGNIYLLLVQMPQEKFQVVGERLKARGLTWHLDASVE